MLDLQQQWTDRDFYGQTGSAYFNAKIISHSPDIA
jgi:hypothetical protein